MFIAVIVVVICYHLLGFTFEAHTFTTSVTCYPIATVYSLNWHLAFFIGASSNIVLLHIFLEGCITTFLSLLTCEAWMNVHFALKTIWLRATITFEIIFDDKVYLFASSRKTISHNLWVLTNILVYCHRNQLGPCIII